MQQAVQNGRGDGGIVIEDTGPVFVGLVGGNNGGALFVAAADDLEEEIGPDFINRQVAQLIEDEQGGSEELFEFMFEASLSLSGAKGVDGFDGRGKENVMSLQAGSVAQGGGQMSFTQSDAADKNDAGFVLEEGQAKEVLHLSLVDFFGPGPVELVERFDDRKASGGDAPNDLPLLPALSFAFDQPSQILNARPLLAGGFIGQWLVVLGHEGQIERFELRGQTEFVVFHGVGLLRRDGSCFHRGHKWRGPVAADPVRAGTM